MSFRLDVVMALYDKAPLLAGAHRVINRETVDQYAWSMTVDFLTSGLPQAREHPYPTESL